MSPVTYGCNQGETKIKLLFLLLLLHVYQKIKKQQLHFYIGYYAISFWDAKYTFSIIEPFNSQK